MRPPNKEEFSKFKDCMLVVSKVLEKDLITRTRLKASLKLCCMLSKSL